MLNFVENLLENERDLRSGPMNDQDHSLSLSDPDRSLVLSHLLLNFLKNLVSCQTSFSLQEGEKTKIFTIISFSFGEVSKKLASIVAKRLARRFALARCRVQIPVPPELV
jgi:hypothetical protein